MSLHSFLQQKFPYLLLIFLKKKKEDLETNVPCCQGGTQRGLACSAQLIADIPLLCSAVSSWTPHRLMEWPKVLFYHSPTRRQNIKMQLSSINKHNACPSSPKAGYSQNLCEPKLGESLSIHSTEAKASVLGLVSLPDLRFFPFHFGFHFN